ncbi:MAG: thiamine diphosphokinase [Oscillospiraceae bacterium]|nr:thiamine diphosphokinase [Oscillospiraceae bacterium]
MKLCTIFCAGEFTSLAQPITPGSTIIAADGGLRHTQALGLQPHIILGDFDSLGHIPEGAQVFPVEKDDTDSMLAIKQGLRMGCDCFHLYGALDGHRVDHTMANFQALHYLCDHGARGYLIGNRQIVCALQGGTLEFPAHFTGFLSVFCLGADAKGVSLQGLKYETDHVVLTAGFPLGVSNQFVGQAARVSVEQGTLLLIWDRENGLL